VFAGAPHDQKFLSHSPERYPKLGGGVNWRLLAIGCWRLLNSSTGCTASGLESRDLPY
jgi:hypothetical protein